MGTALMLYVALGVIGGGLFMITFVLARNPPPERPEFGTRGLKRAEALEDGGLFAAFEPMIRLVAGWVDGVPLKRVKESVGKMVQHSGEYLGLSANEALGMAVISGGFGILVGVGGVYVADFPTISVFFTMGFGMMTPYLNLQTATKERFKSINRTLPAAIDLAALCMGAGLDFPGALKQIKEKSASSAAPLVEEISRILQELELGHTRRKALEGFAERVPTEAVKDFVGTVVQAEAKGTPLSEVLTIQAQMLRMRRSIMAEESAAKAGLMMMGPLMLMFVVIIMLLMAPFIIRLSSSGL